jgi:peptide/nickel transport system ATP-binding protein
VIDGDVPSPIDLPQGCPFAGRCPLVDDRCRKENPVLRALDNGQAVACHAVEEGRD